MSRKLSKKEIALVKDRMNADKIVYLSCVEKSERPTVEIWKDTETGKRYQVVYTLEVRDVYELEEEEDV